MCAFKNLKSICTCAFRIRQAKLLLYLLLFDFFFVRVFLFRCSDSFLSARIVFLGLTLRGHQLSHIIWSARHATHDDDDDGTEALACGQRWRMWKCQTLQHTTERSIKSMPTTRTVAAGALSVFIIGNMRIACTKPCCSQCASARNADGEGFYFVSNSLHVASAHARLEIRINPVAWLRLKHAPQCLHEAQQRNTFGHSVIINFVGGTKNGKNFVFRIS